METVTLKLKHLIKTFGLDHLNTSHLLFLVCVTLSVFLIELYFTGWNNSSLKKIFVFNKSTRTDFIFWLIEIFSFYNIIGFVLSFGICYYLVGQIQKRFAFDLILHIKNPLLQFGLLFLISDFKSYVRHYFFHRSRSLWQLHSVHHSATDLNILTRQRGHFLETEISRFFDVIPFVIFGAPIQTYFFIKILTEAHQMIVHSSLTSHWGFIGKYILVSPSAHRIHHSIDKKHFDKNYGSTFIFWDRIFGTYHPHVKLKQLEYPITHLTNEDILWMYLLQ